MKNYFVTNNSTLYKWFFLFAEIQYSYFIRVKQKGLKFSSHNSNLWLKTFKLL